MKAWIPLLLCLLIAPGCNSGYEAPGYSSSPVTHRLGVQVVPIDTVPLRYELRVDGDPVLEMIAQNAGNHPRAAGLYRGKTIEMRGDVIGGAFEVSVFYDGKHV